MSKSIRHQIIDALVVYLTRYPWITQQLKVVPGRNVFDPANDILPILAVIPEPEVTEKTKYGLDDNSMPVEISALVKIEKQDDKEEYDAIELGEPVKAEIHMAAVAAARDDSLSNLVDSIQYTGGGIADWPSGMGPTIITIGVSVLVTYKTKTGNPFSQN